jgi:ABC-type Fe3+-hydroxamate transport system substrate-binding protein
MPPARDAAASAHASLVDWAGVRHARSRAPRSASLVPSLTELLFALDLGDSVVARTGFCVHPRPAVRRVPKVGGTKDPDLGRLRALAPSHLIVNVDENRREVVEAIAQFVPHVVVTHPQAPDDNLQLYRLFGALFDREAQAEALCTRYAAARADLAEMVDALPRERVLYLIWRKPWMTVRRDTYVAQALACAGFDTLPAQAERRYPEVADDAPEGRAADRILLSTEPYAFRPRDAEALARRHARPVDLVDGQWTSWYGPRAIDGLRALGELRRALTGARAGPR